MSAQQPIHVVVGIIINSNDEILIAERPAHKFCPGLWEFPGGKVEANETPYAALQREFTEELGIQITAAESWFSFFHDYKDRVVFLDTWLIKKYLGEPKGIEGQIIKWIKRDQLNDFIFPEGNRIIINKLLEDK